MDWVNIAFWVFAIAATVSAGAVISVRNPVHAVLCLVLTFFSIACVWLLVGAEFLGVALVLVYVGAVMVLFLFVVMMLDIDPTKLREGWVRYLPVGLIVAVAMLAQMLILIGVKARSSRRSRRQRRCGRRRQLQHHLAGTHAVHRVPAAVRVRRCHPDRGRGCRRDADPASPYRREEPEPGPADHGQGRQRLRMVKMGAEAPVVHSNSKPVAGEEDPAVITLGHILALGAVLFAITWPVSSSTGRTSSSC